MKSRTYLGVSLTRVVPNWHRTHSLEHNEPITDHAALREWSEFEKSNGVELADMLLMEEFDISEIKANRNLCIVKYSMQQKAILESITGKPERFYDYYDGVPQGAPTSPLLSILALIRTVMARDITKMYADDGVKASSAILTRCRGETSLCGIVYSNFIKGYIICHRFCETVIVKKSS